ncbi:MAG: TetR/AcrR family transcriptional regulator [Lachnospiraceae bacterium]|jgi:AcrR family transcriptional regulator|nr:TetR/AcrR family transcriptional regulator [Lachnospiraceae bacterium]
MPKERFLNLPDEKRRRICQAAYEELLRVSYDQLSINQIIRRADISRGSFYQYFQDKDDLLAYMMKDFQESCMKEVRSSIENQEGDIFDICLEVVKKIIAFGEEKEHHQLLKNIFSDLKLGKVQSFEVVCRLDEAFVKEMYPLIHKEDWRISSLDQFMELAEFLGALIRSACAEIFMDIAREEEALRKFSWRLRLIQQGVMKRKEFM